MPRPSRGGARQGSPGTKYANRSDLRGPKALPITTVPGQQYGQATAQANAQKAVPMASGPIGIQGSAGPQTPPAQGGQPAQQWGAPVGGLPDLFGPSQNPNEHLMTGVNAGAGPGSEALTPTLPADPSAEALALLSTLTVKSPAVQSVVDFLSKQAQNQMPH